MKIQSLTTSVTPDRVSPFTSVSDGPAYRAWQERWKAQRGPEWQWSTSPEAMAVEAVQALAQDIETSQGSATLQTLMRLLVVLSLELPPAARSFELVFPSQDGEGNTRAHLHWTLAEAISKKEDNAAVALTLVAENTHDREYLQALGVHNTLGTIPTADALALLDEAGAESQGAHAVSTWEPHAIREALIEGERRWPGLSSPLQALPVVAGWVLWKRGQAMRASESELTLSDVTMDDEPGQAPMTATLRVVCETVAPTDQPRRTPRVG